MMNAHHSITKAPDFSSLPKPVDYLEACKKGEGYAACLAFHMKKEPMMVSSGWLLGQIVRDLNWDQESGASGYAVGFLSSVEVMMHYYAEQHDLDSNLASLSMESVEAIPSRSIALDSNADFADLYESILE